MERTDWVSRRSIVPAGYSEGIRTIRVYEYPKSNKWVMGFVGAARSPIPEDMFSEKFARFTDALMKFVEYSNVGGNRTAGFRRISPSLIFSNISSEDKFEYSSKNPILRRYSIELMKRSLIPIH